MNYKIIPWMWPLFKLLIKSYSDLSSLNGMLNEFGFPVSSVFTWQFGEMLRLLKGNELLRTPEMIIFCICSIHKKPKV